MTHSRLKTPTPNVRFGVLCLLTLGLCWLAVVPAFAATVVVNTTVDQALGDCTSSCSLRDAIATANPGDTVQIPAGVYGLNLNNILIDKDLTLSGAGARDTVIDGADVPNPGAGGILRLTSNAAITVEISDLSLVNGFASGNGGAIFGSGPFTTPPTQNLILRRLLIEGNSSGSGAGVRLFSVGLDMEDCTVSNNESNFGGGGVSVRFGTTRVANSTFTGNRASGSMGLTITEGPGILVNNTITGNVSTTSGTGALFLSLSTFTLSNNVVAGNVGGDCKFFDTHTTAHNLAGDASCNFTGPGDLQEVDPLLGPLADNGGPTDTHALLAGSPAINAGDDTSCPPLDQRGEGRAGVCDMGAYEVQDTDADGILDTDDNCPVDANPGQQDTDLDGQGDACDNDDDNDTVLDVSDNCPLTPNADQDDNDLDGLGDACDADDDNDSVADGADNCPFSANPDQSDVDNDGLGDVCDADADGDGVGAGDNCPLVPNPDQADLDGDGAGDACDTDDDGDGVDDGIDNCPLDANPDQADLDVDNIGDACDADVDGDGITNGADNCPVEANPSQDDTDGDLDGDACDTDDDNDGIDDGADNCQFMVNPDQADSDNDGQGDVCDGDLDGDGVDNEVDNCPLTANLDQFDFDGDGEGDACDADIDNDGVDNGDDLCAFTGFDEVVEAATGCSIDQLCPCDGPRGTTQSWKNHGKYVSCVSKTSKSFVQQGLISNQERGDIVSEAAQSNCGK